LVPCKLFGSTQGAQVRFLVPCKVFGSTALRHVRFLVPCRAHVAKRNSNISKNVIFLNSVLLHRDDDFCFFGGFLGTCSKTQFKKMTFFVIFELRFAT